MRKRTSSGVIFLLVHGLLRLRSRIGVCLDVRVGMEALFALLPFIRVRPARLPQLLGERTLDSRPER